MILVKNLFDFGQAVYLITDVDQRERYVTAIKLFPGNVVAYSLSCGATTTTHYEFEISAEKNYSHV